MVDNSELYARYNPLADKVGPAQPINARDRERQMFAQLRQQELDNQKREIEERKRNQELMRKQTILNKELAKKKAKQEEELRQANEAKCRAQQK